MQTVKIVLPVYFQPSLTPANLPRGGVIMFSFCANAKFKDIACIFNHHYHVFHVLLNLLSITHDPDYVTVSIVYRVTR